MVQKSLLIYCLITFEVRLRDITEVREYYCIMTTTEDKPKSGEEQHHIVIPAPASQIP
jgi:hypothetical protein